MFAPSRCLWATIAAASIAAAASGAVLIPIAETNALASSTYTGTARLAKYAVNGAGLTGSQHTNGIDTDL